jgi:hypothetical protein
VTNLRHSLRQAGARTSDDPDKTVNSGVREPGKRGAGKAGRYKNGRREDGRTTAGAGCREQGGGKTQLAVGGWQ